MHHEPFVYFLPRTDVAAQKKHILVIEKQPGTPVVMSETSSIQQAAALIGTIRDRAPRTHIIVDTGASAGRAVLLRIRERLTFNDREYDPCLFLSQLFPTLQSGIPEKPYGADDPFAQHAASLVFAPRSTGGRRPCTKTDLLIALVGLDDKEPEPGCKPYTDLFLHPLCLVPRFFALESNRALGTKEVFLPDELVTEMVRLAYRFAAIRQSPFPDDRPNKLFTAWEQAAGARSRMDDFIYSALGGTTRTRRKLHERHPAQVEIVRIVDRLMKTVDIRRSRLFHGSLNGERYARIRAFIELVFGVWMRSEYADARVRPPVVDTSLLSPDVRKRFEHMIPQR